MPLTRARTLLTDDELTAYFLAVWNEVVGPVCDGRNEHVLDDFVASHTKKEYPATEWRFQGSQGFGGKLHTDFDMRTRVSCYPEDETPARREAMNKANAMLKEIHGRFFAEKMKAAEVESR